jgi:hypothetical protein
LEAFRGAAIGCALSVALFMRLAQRLDWLPKI